MTRDELPLVTIITPSFNQARFLPAALQAVAAQDYPRIEHIVMDGGSTDGSVEIIRAWAETHQLTWRSAPDGGQAAAIKQGVALSTGEILAWLNSDDIYLDASVITDVVEVFRSGAQIVTGSGWHINEAGDRLRHIAVDPRRITHETLRYVDWMLQPATFVRRDLFLSCPIDTDLHWVFDWDLFIRLTAKAPATAIARDIAGYRLHSSGKTVSGGSERQRELLRVIRRYHGQFSRAYLLLLPVVMAHRVADRLPTAVGSRLAFVLGKFAAATLRIVNGRGIQP